MQQATFGDTDLFLRQSFKNGRYTTKVDVLFLKNQMYMDNFTHDI